MSVQRTEPVKAPAKHVELFGIPGSGKSTLQRRLVETEGWFTLQSASRRCRIRVSRPESDRVLELLPRPFRHVASKLLASDQAFRIARDAALEEYDALAGTAREEIDRTMSAKQRDRFVGIYSHLLGHYYVVSKYLGEDECVTLDEGFVHRTINLFCSPDPSSEFDYEGIARYLDQIPRPDQVVVLDVPVNVAKERIGCRESGWPQRCDDMSVEHRLTFLRRTADCVDYVASEIAEWDDTELLRIDGTDDPAEVVRTVRRKL